MPQPARRTAPLRGAGARGPASRMGALLAAAGALLVAGCGGDGPATPAPHDLDGRNFVVTAISGRPLVAPERVRIEFEPPGSSNSTGGCNDSESTYAIAEGRLQRGDLRSHTAVGCGEPLESQDAWFDAWLDDGPTVTLEGDRLTLEHGAVRVELEERPLGQRGTP